MTRILCLWFPNWPIQWLIRSRSELKERPAALVAAAARGAEVVACCSTAARQGVHPGMPLAEAQALAPDLVAAPHDPTADRRALEQLAETCQQFTPCVGLEDADEPECLLLDVSNLEHLWGSEEKLAARVKSFFTRRGYDVRLAVADTVGLAWAQSHFLPSSNLHFAVCSPQRVRLVLADNLHFAISSLAVEALRIPDNTAALLRQLGITTIQQLHALPRESLASRFGEELLRRLDQLTGAAPEVIEPHHAPAALEATCELDEPTADRAMLMHVLGQLVERLTRRLAERDQGAVLLVCLLHSPAGCFRVARPESSKGVVPNINMPRPSPTQGVPPEYRVLPLRIGLLQPSANARQLLELIELHLEAVTLCEEVDRVELRAAVVGRLGERQRELFADRWSTDPHQVALLVNRLSSRLGCERVLRAELRASAAPERAVRYAPVTERRDRKLQIANCPPERGGPAVASKMKIANWKGGKARRPTSEKLQFAVCNLQAPRPLLLHPQPQPIEVVSIAPDGPPQFVWLEGYRERIVHCTGPERIETLWWRGRSLRRDYYRAATETGSHLWIFRRRSDARWFLHGIFT